MLHPLLPPEYLKLIQSEGIPLNQWNPGSEETAWPWKTASRALELLRDTNVAIIGGDLAFLEDGRLCYRVENWGIHTKDGEDAKDYVRRSHEITKEFLAKSRDWTAPHQPLYVFVLTAVVV